MPTRVLPAEWAPQSAVQLTWPHADSDWAPVLDRVEPVFSAIAREVARRQRLVVACHDDAHRERVGGLLRDAGIEMTRVGLHLAPSNDSWARDHGPITIIEGGRPVLLDFIFNGWGNKYPSNLDNSITSRLVQRGAFDRCASRSLPLVLEGGGIESDGAGTLLTTESCLLAPTRNPQLTRTQLETHLRDQLGVRRVLWLKHGHLLGDDTDGHIDTLARFCDERTIAYVRCDDPGDEHYADLSAMEAELRTLHNAAGGAYRLVPLPWPRAKRDAGGRRLPATYANFLIINGAVLVPTYDDPADVTALAALAGCFPDREIVAIDCSALILQNGSLHCVTMQLPAGVLPPV